MVTVYFYIPNIIDYLRLVFLLTAWYFINVPNIFLTFYCVQASLDYFDGYFARVLKQTSTFGAWLDVIIDNLGRGLIWVHVHQIGYSLTCIEWLTFSCTHAFGAYWKQVFSDQNNLPLIVQTVMKDNFKTKIGFLSIFGLHCLPIWLYLLKYYENYLLGQFAFISNGILGVACIGRFLCLYVELWIIQKHIQKMVADDVKTLKS